MQKIMCIDDVPLANLLEYRYYSIIHVITSDNRSKTAHLFLPSGLRSNIGTLRTFTRKIERYAYE